MASPEEEKSLITSYRSMMQDAISGKPPPLLQGNGVDPELTRLADSARNGTLPNAPSPMGKSPYEEALDAGASPGQALEAAMSATQAAVVQQIQREALTKAKDAAPKAAAMAVISQNPRAIFGGAPEGTEERAVTSAFGVSPGDLEAAIAKEVSPPVKMNGEVPSNGDTTPGRLLATLTGGSGTATSTPRTWPIPKNIVGFDSIAAGGNYFDEALLDAQTLESALPAEDWRTLRSVRDEEAATRDIVNPLVVSPRDKDAGVPFDPAARAATEAADTQPMEDYIQGALNTPAYGIHGLPFDAQYELVSQKNLGNRWYNPKVQQYVRAQREVVKGRFVLQKLMASFDGSVYSPTGGDLKRGSVGTEGQEYYADFVGRGYTQGKEEWEDPAVMQSSWNNLVRASDPSAYAVRKEDLLGMRYYNVARNHDYQIAAAKAKAGLNGYGPMGQMKLDHFQRLLDEFDHNRVWGDKDGEIEERDLAAFLGDIKGSAWDPNYTSPRAQAAPKGI